MEIFQDRHDIENLGRKYVLANLTVISFTASSCHFSLWELPATLITADLNIAEEKAFVNYASLLHFVLIWPLQGFWKAAALLHVPVHRQPRGHCGSWQGRGSSWAAYREELWQSCHKPAH